LRAAAAAAVGAALLNLAAAAAQAVWLTTARHEQQEHMRLSLEQEVLPEPLTPLADQEPTARSTQQPLLESVVEAAAQALMLGPTVRGVMAVLAVAAADETLGPQQQVLQHLVRGTTAATQHRSRVAAEVAPVQLVACTTQASHALAMVESDHLHTQPGEVQHRQVKTSAAPTTFLAVLVAAAP